MKTKNKNILLVLTVVIVLFAIERVGVEIPHFNVLNLILMIAFVYPMVYIHEIGHVVAAKFVGIEISRVQFGNGRELFRRKVFGVLWIFKNRLGAGYTFVGKLHKGFSKPAFALFIAGGLILQTIVTIMAILLSDFRFDDFIGNYEVDIPASFIMANIIMVTMTLLPMKGSFRGISIPNDGLHLFKLPFVKTGEINAILSAAQIMEAFELYESKRYYDAQMAFERCILDFPDSILAKIDYSTCMLKQGKIHDAERLLLEIYNAPHDKKYDLMLLNNIAWINLLKFDCESLETARDFSYKAIKINPNISFIRGTRASVLIASGKYDEGINIIRGAMKISKPIDAETNSIVGCMMLGFAFTKKSDWKKTGKYMAKLKENIGKLDEDEKILLEKLKEDSEEFRNEICK